MTALTVRDLTVRFDGRAVVDGFGLSLDTGEVIALVGPSGSGKSTVLRVIAGLLHPDTGTVTIGGRDVSATPTHVRDVGMVFQDEQLFPHLDVRRNIAFGLRMHGWDRGRIAARVDEMLRLVDLDGFGRRTVTSLSGGEAKRVALARSLAPAPSVLLLDEPLTGLDRDLHEALAAEVARILRASATTAVLVTHDRHEAELIADRIVPIASGQTT